MNGITSWTLLCVAGYAIGMIQGAVVGYLVGKKGDPKAAR